MASKHAEQDTARMNRRIKVALWALPLSGLCVALVWVKWKAEHPPPTKLDIQVRQRLVDSKDAMAVIRIPLYSSIRLSKQDMKDISDHLFLKEQVTVLPSKERLVEFYWTTSPKNECVMLDESDNRGYYAEVNTPNGANCHELHPVTTRFLRQWLAQRPEFLRWKD